MGKYGQCTANFQYMDILRGLSAIIIVGFHYSSALVEYGFDGYTNYFYHYANNYWGTVGVNLFFLLSGAGLWMGYGHDWELLRYYKRRWMKIFPMFYLCWTPLYFLNALFIKKDFFYAGNPVKILLTVAGVDGYLLSVSDNYYIIGEWFLGAVIIMYLIFPILRRLLYTKILGWVAISILFVLCCVNDRMGFPYIPCREWIGYYVFIFWLGMLLMEYWTVIERYVNWYFCLFLMASLLFVDFGVPWKNDLLSIVLSLCITCFFMSKGNEMHGVFTKFLKVVARYSYAIFLVHHVIIDMFFKLCSGIISRKNVSAILLLLCAVIFICAVVLDKIEKMIVKKGA